MSKSVKKHITGKARFRIMEHHSACGTSVSFWKVASNGRVTNVCGHMIPVNAIVSGLKRSDVGTGAIWEITATLIKPGKPEANPFKHRKARQAHERVQYA